MAGVKIQGPKCRLLGTEVSFHEGPKCLDEGPKCLFQKGPKCPIGAEVVGAEVAGAEVSKIPLKLRQKIKCSFAKSSEKKLCD